MHSSGRRKAAPSIPLVSGSPTSYKNSLMFEETRDEPPFPSMVAFDHTLLHAYRMNDMSENAGLVNLIQTLYMNGSDCLKSGLNKLVTSMLESATLSSTMNQELSEKHQKISELESRITNMESTSESKIELLQEKIQERDNQYESLASMVSDMSSQAAIASQLRHDKETLQSQMDELKTQLLSKRKRMDDLTGKEVRVRFTHPIHLLLLTHLLQAILSRVNRMFDDPSNGKPIQYPVIQQNGVIVDLYKVVLAWARNSNEDDDHPYRNYICPVTRTQTSLARIGIIAKIQEIALELGRDLTPPIEFEFKNLSEKWTKFGLMDQLRILAKISCMYFNNIATSAIMVKNDQICFDILLEKCDGGLALKCNAQDKSAPVDLTVRVKLDGQNPFPDIKQFQT